MRERITVGRGLIDFQLQSHSSVTKDAKYIEVPLSPTEAPYVCHNTNHNSTVRTVSSD